MERRTVLALSGTALAGLAGCAALGSDPESTPTDTPENTTEPDDTTSGTPDVSTDLRNPSFEDGWNAWEVGRHLPEDPNQEGEQSVPSEVGVTTWQSSDGNASLKLVIDGRQDDGTVWVQQPVDLSGYESVSVDYHVATGFNHIRNAAVYAGPAPEDPLTERDFDTSESLEGHASEGWKTLTFDVAHDGPGVVAVGFSVVWETRSTALVDNVVLSESPPPTPTPTTSAPTTDAPENGSQINESDGNSARID